MSKRKAATALLDRPPTPLKKARVDESYDTRGQAAHVASSPLNIKSHVSLPPSPRQQSPKRSSAEAFAAEESLDAASKRARIDDSPSDSTPRTRSPSPWPLVDDNPSGSTPRSSRSPSPWPLIGYSPEPIDWEQERRRQRWCEIEARAALRRAEMCQEYIDYRSRLASPSLTDNGGDPDVDENGMSYYLLGLDSDEESEIERVFGPRYARSLKERRRQRKIIPYSHQTLRHEVTDEEINIVPPPVVKKVRTTRQTSSRTTGRTKRPRKARKTPSKQQPLQKGANGKKDQRKKREVQDITTFMDAPRSTRRSQVSVLFALDQQGNTVPVQ